jgi:UDP-N-acetylmuramoylalanine--D-glutamate ligase
VLIVGLARSGVAAAEFLVRRGAQVRGTDLRSEVELSAELSGLRQIGVELVLGSHPPGLVSDIDLVIASPGVPLHALPLREAQAKGVPLWGELELAFRQIRGEVIAVTGTKGKSTTASLIAEVLKRAGRSVYLGGNIGRPLIGLVEEASRDSVFVVEVSSFQLETIESFRPRIAVLLDVTPDHLDWHPSFDAYVQAKQRIFTNQEAGDWAVVYGGNPLTLDMASKARSKKIYFSYEGLGDRERKIRVEGPWIVRSDGGETRPLVRLESIPLKGRHNVENIMAALGVASVVDIEPELLALAVGDFSGVPHALERVAELDGVVFYNDSKATNLAAAAAALESFDPGVFLILGGRSKAGDFKTLRTHVKRNVKRVLAIGESKHRIESALSDLVPVVTCRSLKEAVETAFRSARPGDTVLLSPACASFDMFTDYAERGERFREEVEKLAKRTRRFRSNRGEESNGKD